MKNIRYIVCLIWILLPSFGQAQELLSDKVITWKCTEFKDEKDGGNSNHQMDIVTDSLYVTLVQGNYEVNFEIVDRDWDWEDKGKITYQAKLLNSTGTITFKSKNDRTEIKVNLNGSSGKFHYTLMADSFTHQ